MDKKILIFFALLIVFCSLMFLPDLRQDTDIFFLSFFLSNRVWFFIILGILLFLYGKQINSNNNSLYYNNYLSFVIYIFFFSFFLLFLNSYLNSDFFQFFYNNNNFNILNNLFLNIEKLNYIFFIVIVVLGFLIYDFKIKNNLNINDIKENKNFLYNKHISLFLIFLLFIGIRFGYPLLLNGSYIDEYNHIFSGIDFFENGSFSIFNTEGEYKRGAFLSIYLGIFFILFGKSIFVAKISISILSILSFILLYKISKIIYNNKTLYINLLLLIFTLNPLLIFEHFYIRPYIVYEISILYIVYVFFKIFEFIDNKENFKILLSIILVNLLGFVIYYFSEKDVHRYIILLFSTCITFYFYVFQSQNIEFKSLFLKKFFNINKKNKILIIFLTIPLLFFQFNLDHLLIAIFENRQYYGSSSEISKYYELFFSQYFLFTIFFIFFYIYLFFQNRKNKYIFIYLMILLLLGSHLLSNINSHLIRGIIYILPLFFLISIYGLYLFNNLFPKKINYFIVFFLFLSIIFSYNLNFIKGPFIKSEINYMEYNKVSEFLKNNCKDKEIIALIHNPYILSFYGVKVDYTSNIYINDKGQLEKYIFNNNSYNTIYKNIPVITDMVNLKEKILINSCIVLNEESKHYWYYFDNNYIYFLRQNFNSIKYGEQTPINIFYN